MANEERAIRAVMASYNDALNRGSTDAALMLYAEDGVFMAPYSQSAVGKEAVSKAYDAVFRELKFDVKFSIAELWTPQAKATLTREPSHHPATSRRSTKLGILSPASRACELDEARQVLPLGEAHGERASRLHTTAGLRK